MADVTMQELQDIIKAAIGYDQVPVSIDGYPEIHWTFRTLKDRDDLVKKISHAVFPLLMAQRVDHEWEAPYSAASDLCGAMVMRDGGGDQCGLPKVLHPKKEN